MSELIRRKSESSGSVEELPPFRVLSLGDVRRSSTDSVAPSKLSSSSEDHYSEKKLETERLRFTRRLVSLIQEEPFEYGIDTRTDAFVRAHMKRNRLLTKDWLNRLFTEYFPNIPVLVGLLRIIARLDYLDIYPQGQTMALAALSHKDVEILECGIRAFENWETIDSLKVLENLKVSTAWLQEYVDKVVLYLRKEHNASAR